MPHLLAVQMRHPRCDQGLDHTNPAASAVERIGYSGMLS